MIYLFNSAARAGYIENVLNTLHLPKGAENVYQYSIRSGPYVHASVSEARHSEEVLIIFADKDAEPYRFVPLRKARLLRKETIDGRMYFTVIMGDYCVPNNYDYGKFSRSFAEAFGDLVFRARSEEDADRVDTKEQKNNKGFLAFEGVSFGDNISVTDDAWLSTVEAIKKVKILEDNICVYTKLRIKKDGGLLPTSDIEKAGDPAFEFSYGSKYCAELSYYIPFQDEKTGSFLEVEMISNPDGASLKGGALRQRLNVMQGVANYRFKASEVVDSGEIIFSVKNAAGVSAENVKTAWRGVNYKIKRSGLRWAGILCLLILAAASSLGVAYFTDCIKTAGASLKGGAIPYYILSAISSLALPGCIWGASTLWGKKG